MVVSNRERVGKALEAVRDGIGPFVAREMEARYGDGWQADHLPSRSRSWDTTALLSCIIEQWNMVFSSKLSAFDRSLAFELRDARNKWAHDEPFTLDDAYRVLDSATRLLRIVGATQADDTEREMQEIMRVRYEENAKREIRRAAVAPTEGRPAGGLRPWREVITPHPDVASGRYAQAEFAASLAQVHAGSASDEYGKPADFFARTYLTDGLKRLLRNAVTRLTGQGGDPVVKLQTNFGGGKTHAMIALYHLAGGSTGGDLPGIEEVLREAGADRAPKAARAVLVGTALSASAPRPKPDGIETRTLWGEMAHQLGGAAAYALVESADKNGVSPGSDALVAVFRQVGPCVVLIDEWVVYARNLKDDTALPGGSYSANMSFAQSLTEAAAEAKTALVVASIPASDNEMGGEFGKEVAARLENIFRRVEDTWQPATTEEGFEIVRRRLFNTVNDAVARDAVAKAFAEMYRKDAGEFPPHARDAEYERRIRTAYPIHPELFDDLFERWSHLDRFQRTRGVLQLMAKVVHHLWERNDGNLLILPGMVPLDEPAVKDQLLGFLDPGWRAVVEADVDGGNALPTQLDRDNAGTLGRYAAARRAARSVFLCSAPMAGLANRGVEERYVKLACTQPGESVATFGDALRRLTNEANYLYGGEGRYWYATQPSVTRTAQGWAAQFSDDDVTDELRKRLREKEMRGAMGDFMRVHLYTGSSGDIPDETEARLVVLDPAFPHTARDGGSPARVAAAQILDTRGTAPRQFRNTLAFLAPDTKGLESLARAVRDAKAWQRVDTEKGAEGLNLDAQQVAQAANKLKEAWEIVNVRIPEAYQWLIVPGQPDPRDALVWDENRLTGTGSLAERASRRMHSDGTLIREYGGVVLRLELDRIPLWRDEDNDIDVAKLWDYYAKYLYLPRLRDSGVLLGAIRQGAGQMLWATETFAYAEGWDAERKQYIGLQTGTTTGGVRDVPLNDKGRVVRPEAALRQIAADERRAEEERGRREEAARQRREEEGQLGNGVGGNTIGLPLPPPRPPVTPPVTQHRRYHGSVELNAMQPTGQVSAIAQQILTHFNGVMGANVRVTLEIAVETPDAIPDQMVDAVQAKAATLHFATSEFDE